MEKWFEIKMAADGKASVYILDTIGGWGITANAFAKDIKQLGDVKSIDVHINSPGGSVSDGVAIYNLLKKHSASISIVVDGWALSAASLIAMAGDEIIMNEGSVMMIHDPSTGIYGNAEELKKNAELLDKIADQMAAIYANKTGVDKADTREMMKETVWMTAEEAVDQGFADRLGEETTATVFHYDKVAAEYKLPQNFNLTNHVQKEDKTMQQMVTDKSTKANSDNETITSHSQQNETPQASDISAKSDNQLDVRAQERQRSAEIAALGRFHDLSSPQINALILSDSPITAIKAKILDMKAAAFEQTPTVSASNVQFVADGWEKFNQGVTLSLLNRGGIDGGERNEFSSMSLSELAREVLAQSGRTERHKSKLDMIGDAFTIAGQHGTSDFGRLLSGTAEKSLLKGYQEADETFQSWTSEGTLSDFKMIERVDLSAFPNLDKVEEGGEYQHGTSSDRGETVQLATYGKLFAITRQAIINDDLGAFTRIPQRMGRAAIRTVANLVYAQLTGSVKMSDGKQLFDSNHANILSIEGLTSENLDQCRQKMGSQKSDKVILNITPRYAIVPLALQGKLISIFGSEYDSEYGDKRRPNMVRDMIARENIIADARLDASSKEKFYFSANPNAHDAIEVSYLDGNKQPFLEQKQGWSVDGTEYKVRIDAGVKALDYRTLQQIIVQNPAPEDLAG